MTTSQLAVLKLYNIVVDDVISGVRNSFLDDGVDEQVLQELKQLWKTKLQASGATDPLQPEPMLPPPPVLQNFQKVNGSNVVHKRTDMGHTSGQQEHSAPASSVAGTHTHHILDPNNKVPVQLTLPAQPGVPGSQPRSFTIQIPASALNGNKLHQVLTGPIINATISLPQPLAATLLQQHINSALAGQKSDFDSGGGGRSGTAPFSLDGALDSSDDDGSNVGDGSEDGAADDDDDDDSPEERAEEEEEEQNESGGAEEEPLNSGDDVSDEEPGDMFDTDNVVVCQYDKITRSRNRWKFYLKDGIMNLAGKDYVFQKANGDAEW
ncbi:transcription initiation factor IIA subunit 1 [Bombyx mandarina]|uniref:Transcription initiation factor IIA subunit 1 n=2 Tax=Bombyx TaxID=7090 RepID=A0A8R2GB91_BOMMO|nr:transcription initiation factor IIA subunit 1 [Bombyx mori]XP_028039022.1 transcription initiation factor IIA subunit 1 [Bombyx mandarina]